MHHEPLYTHDGAGQLCLTATAVDLIDANAAGIRADLERVHELLCDLPCLTYMRAYRSLPDITTGTAILSALVNLKSTDAEKIAAFDRIQSELLAKIGELAEDKFFDEHDDAYGARRAA